MLSDAEKRRQYDQFGHAAFEGGAGGAGAGGFDFDFGDMGDIFGDLFGGMFGGGGSRRNSNGPRRGADVRVNVRITFDESVRGTTKKIDVTLKDECSSCHGTGAKPGTSPENCSKCGGRGQVTFTQQSFLGMVRSQQPCPDCHGTGKIIKEKCPDCYGTGYISSKKTIEVNIPAGIDNGQCVRRASSVAHIGAIDLGGDNPIRIQSMTTTNTNDTEACVQQAEEIIKAGGELVRFTTQGSREAENMKNINAGIRADGYQTPLVADVHFNPNVADVAALYCEKVRVNPGNYVDPARKFIKQEYTDEEYAHELQKIEDRFVPFLNICTNRDHLDKILQNMQGDHTIFYVENGEIIK